jgi:hypothetical protein
MIDALKRVKHVLSGEGKEMIPSFIIIHHSLTKDSQTVSWSAIRRYHVHQLGWLDIGYHFGIELVGGNEGYEILVGRMMDETGAHCRHKSMNRKALGICFVGNFNERRPPERQWRAGVRLVRCLMRMFNIDETNVLGHCEATEDHRTCPGEKFDMNEFRADVAHS